MLFASETNILKACYLRHKYCGGKVGDSELGPTDAIVPALRIPAEVPEDIGLIDQVLLVADESSGLAGGKNLGFLKAETPDGS
jgi:hypothetical protein